MTGEEFLRKIDREVFGGGGEVARLRLAAVPCSCGVTLPAASGDVDNQKHEPEGTP